MKNLKLKVDNVLPEASLDGVDKIGIDLASFKKGSFNYRTKDFGIRFNADLLAKSNKVLDSGFIYLNFSKDLFESLTEDADTYSFDVVLKGFEEEYSKTETVKLKVSETEKEVLDTILDPANKAKEGLDNISEQIQQLLDKTDNKGQKLLNTLNTTLCGCSDKACSIAKTGKEKAKDFAQRAKTNDLTKKELAVVGSVAGVILAAIFASKRK